MSHDSLAGAPPSLLVRTPPPLLFAAALAIALVIERKIPVGLLPAVLASYGGVLSAVLLVGGGALAGSAATIFRLRHTTLSPAGEPSSLVVVGPFRWTRNPMYLSLTLVVLGAAAWGNTAWPVMLLPAPLLALEFAIIPFEERTLTDRFGDDYRAYCGRVRRWV